ncbi:MAG TPA: hypothetical protein VLL48_10745 [Longimicrobiales bacterium]|nr:hypothetical protein [Longimicrobiales bacterium]
MDRVTDLVRCAACGREQERPHRQGVGRVNPVNPDTREQWWSRAVPDDGADDAPLADRGTRIEYACSSACRRELQA